MYMTHLDALGRHNFVDIPDDISHVWIDEGHWEDFIRNPKYLAKKKADEISYAWDRLIEHFISSGEVGFEGDRRRDVATMEPALRVLASESRLARRQLAAQLINALSREVPPGSRFLRVGFSKQNMETTYVFLVLPRPPHIKTYAEYRDARRAILIACCKVAHLQMKSSRRVIGIATEPSGTSGSSEDLLLLDFDSNPWDADQEAEARMLQQNLGILLDGQARYYELHDNEYPDLPSQSK